jgi:hypothetical protein
VRAFLPSVLRRYPTAVAIYALFALHSLLFQAFIRLEQCSGLGNCAGSLAKDLAWSLIWPVYWLVYWSYL